MRIATRALAALAGTAAACGAAAGPAPDVPTVPHAEQDLAADDGLVCRAYIVAGGGPITDVVLSMGGTGAGTSAFLPDGERDLVATGRVAVVRFDKPGVRAMFGNPASVRIDAATLARHTQGTLLACAGRAMQLAVDRFGPGIRVHLRGHSEGALIAITLHDQLLATQAPVAARVRSLVLTGLPLEPFAELLRRQLATAPGLAAAFARCDPSLVNTTGVSCAYLADAQARRSGRAVFERLASRTPAVEIYVFAGTDDANTPARFVRDLEVWNAASGHLDLHVRYYDGSHSGTPDTRGELASLMARLTAAGER